MHNAATYTVLHALTRDSKHLFPTPVSTCLLYKNECDIKVSVALCCHDLQYKASSC